MSDALEVYENQYKLYNDSKIQEEALFKAAVASYKLGDLENFTILRQEYGNIFKNEELFDNLSHIRAITLWKEKEYDQALYVIEAIKNSDRRKSALNTILAIDTKQTPAEISRRIIKNINSFDSFWSVSLMNRDLNTLNQLVQQNCYMLNIAGNNISSLDSISQLKKLNVLIAENNNITGLDPIKTLPLKRLIVARNPLKSVAVLKDHPTLKELIISGTKVSDLSELGSLELKELAISGTKITSLEPLNISRLNQLLMGYTQIKDLSPLRKAKKLNVLSLMRTQCNDLAPIKNLPIDSLSISVAKGIKVENLDIIGDLPLTTLHLQQFHYNDLAFLKRSKKIIRLKLIGSQAGSLKELFDGAPFMKTLRSLILINTKTHDVEFLASLNLIELKISPQKDQSLDFIAEMDKLLKLRIGKASYALPQIVQIKKLIKDTPTPITIKDLENL